MKEIEKLVLVWFVQNKLTTKQKRSHKTGKETKGRRNVTWMPIRSDQLEAKCANLNSFGCES